MTELGNRHMDSILSLSPCKVSISIYIYQTFQIWDCTLDPETPATPFVPLTIFVFYPLPVMESHWPQIIFIVSSKGLLCPTSAPDIPSTPDALAVLTQGWSINHRKQALCFIDFRNLENPQVGFQKNGHFNTLPQTILVVSFCQSST